MELLQNYLYVKDLQYYNYIKIIMPYSEVTGQSDVSAMPGGPVPKSENGPQSWIEGEKRKREKRKKSCPFWGYFYACYLLEIKKGFPFPALTPTFNFQLDMHFINDTYMYVYCLT